jgi:hypothetical protein
MKSTLIIFLLFFSISVFSQENSRGTIKVQKKGNVYAVMFDNINNRLIGKDNYGNILDSAVVSYTMQITIQGRSYTENVEGTTLSPLMQQRITRVDSGTSAFFYNIRVKEKSGKEMDWPKFTARLGYAFEKEEN